MLSALTEQETKIADGLQAIMQGYLADEGNQESMKVFGYRKFTEEHLLPITSDPNHVQSKIGDILEGGVKRPVSGRVGQREGTTKGPPTTACCWGHLRRICPARGGYVHLRPPTWARWRT